MKTEGLLEYLLFHYRWVFVCFFLLPCTILYDLYSLFKKYVVTNTRTLLTEHNLKVKHIQKQVKEWISSGQNVPMCTSRPGWKSMTLREPKYKQTMYNIDVEMSEILYLDEDRRIIRVEPLVTMGQLSTFLDPLGLTLPILVELDDLTVGGLIMGTGIESSSHIYGLFQHICVSFELVLADGSCVTCSKDSDPDLFYSIPWSYGTLGFLTAVDLRITSAKKFVELTYKPVYSLEEAVNLFEYESTPSTGNQFVEGILFNQNEGVIMTGKMTNTSKNVNTISRWYKPWFFEHVRSFLLNGEGKECIPLRDYYHRHTKSLFWELQDIVPFGNHLLFRCLLGWAMPPKIAFLKLTQTKAIKKLYDEHHVVQDLMIPMKSMKEAILKFEKQLNIYPVWLCPFKLPSEPGLVHSFSDKDELYVDIGLYGTPKVEDYDSVKTTKEIEKYVSDVKGYQMLYAGTYASEDEFRDMFDHSLYNRIRKRLHCEKAFANVYGKINRKVRD
uniref:Delta(24)-sterol reductase n=2 Tax=Clastoptera arizonana TaxID=38151 RepID=A0A1B6C4R1_9HEMI